MLDIFLYAAGIMYSPGPANCIAMHQGATGRFRQALGFAAGVGVSLCLLFLLLGFSAGKWMPGGLFVIISAAGCAYMLYLAQKIWTASPNVAAAGGAMRSVGFWDGLGIALLNPKIYLAVLPIVTIQFPAASISGARLALVSVLLACLGGGAQVFYALLGKAAGKRIERSKVFGILNKILAMLLVYVAVRIGVEHVATPLWAFLEA